MFVINKYKYKIIKRYNEDLWGRIRLKRKYNKVGYLLIYLIQDNLKKFVPFFFVIAIEPPIRKRRYLSEFGNLLELRKKLCIYYGGFRKKHYRKFGYIAKKIGINFTLNMLTLLEGNLAFCIYRMNFVATLGQAIHFVLCGNVLVNKEVIKQIRYNIKVGDVVEIIGYKKNYCFYQLLSRLEAEEIIHLELSYGIISYSNMCGMIYKVVEFDDVMYSFDNISKDFFTAEFYNKL